MNRCRMAAGLILLYTHRRPLPGAQDGYNGLIRTFRNLTVPAAYWRAIGPSTCFVSFTSTTFSPLRTTVNCDPSP